MSIYHVLRPLLPEGLILSDEPMSRHTSFKIGGPAEVYITPQDTNQLAKVFQACKEAGYPTVVIGGGCNTLVSDEGVQGVVISTCGMSYTSICGNYITAGSGTKLSKLADAACKAGLSGLEFASGIPGTVGGAVFMNAGAYKYEIKDVCEEVTALLPD
ncbi:MAG: FAD-binding protein, partial [Defluviitaleaceae bacterium]|nr:FAD-binding protein [Defluviitaleaceae bacterium]